MATMNDPAQGDRLLIVRAVSEGLLQMREEDVCTDFNVVVQGVSFRCHKVVLASVSDYFRAMFTSGMKETIQNETIIDNITPETFKRILDLLYELGRSDYPLLDVSDDMVVDLLRVSDMLQMKCVAEISKAHLTKSMSASNCMERWLVGKSLDLDELVKMSWDFAISNFEKIVSERVLRELSFEDFESILKDENLEVKKERNVWRVISDWINFDMANRQEHIVDLLRQCCLTEVDSRCLTENIAFHPAVRKNNEASDLVHEAICFRNHPSIHGNIELKYRQCMKKQQVDVAVGVTEDEYGEEQGCLNIFDSESGELINSLTHSRPMFDFACCVHSNNLYVSGGEGRYGKHLYEFSGTEMTWHKLKGDLPVPLKQHTMTSTDQSLFAISGSTTNMLNWAIFSYPLGNNAWARHGDVVAPVKQASSTCLHDKIYIIGGLTEESQPAMVIQEYDINNKSATIIIDLPKPCLYSQTLVRMGKVYTLTSDGDIYIFDVSTMNLEVLRTVQEMDGIQPFGIAIRNNQLKVFASISATVDASSDDDIAAGNAEDMYIYEDVVMPNNANNADTDVQNPHEEGTGALSDEEDEVEIPKNGVDGMILGNHEEPDSEEDDNDVGVLTCPSDHVDVGNQVRDKGTTEEGKRHVDDSETDEAQNIVIAEKRTDKNNVEHDNDDGEDTSYAINPEEHARKVESGTNEPGVQFVDSKPDDVAKDSTTENIEEDTYNTTHSEENKKYKRDTKSQIEIENVEQHSDVERCGEEEVNVHSNDADERVAHIDNMELGLIQNKNIGNCASCNEKETLNTDDAETEKKCVAKYDSIEKVSSGERKENGIAHDSEVEEDGVHCENMETNGNDKPNSDIVEHDIINKEGGTAFAHNAIETVVHEEEEDEDEDDDDNEDGDVDDNDITYNAVVNENIGESNSGELTEAHGNNKEDVATQNDNADDGVAYTSKAVEGRSQIVEEDKQHNDKYNTEKDTAHHYEEEAIIPHDDRETVIDTSKDAEADKACTYREEGGLTKGYDDITESGTRDELNAETGDVYHSDPNIVDQNKDSCMDKIETHNNNIEFNETRADEKEENVGPTHVRNNGTSSVKERIKEYEARDHNVDQFKTQANGEAKEETQNDSRLESEENIVDKTEEATPLDNADDLNAHGDVRAEGEVAYDNDLDLEDVESPYDDLEQGEPVNEAPEEVYVNINEVDNDHPEEYCDTLLVDLATGAVKTAKLSEVQVAVYGCVSIVLHKGGKDAKLPPAVPPRNYDRH